MRILIPLPHPLQPYPVHQHRGFTEQTLHKKNSTKLLICFCRSLASLDLWPPDIDNDESAREQCKEEVDESSTPTGPTQRRENDIWTLLSYTPRVVKSLASYPQTFCLGWILPRSSGELRGKTPNGKPGYLENKPCLPMCFGCRLLVCILAHT